MPAPSDWTRVKDPETGHEYSTLVVVPGLDVIDKPAADAYGRPLPPKHNRPLSSLTSPTGTPVAEMKVAELLDYAAANGVELGDSPRKDDILTAIAMHEGDSYQAAPEQGGVTTTPAA